MEAGPSRSTMMGFGENSSGIFPRTMMMPLMNPNSETNNKAFLPPPWTNINSDQHSRRLPQKSGKHHNSGRACLMESSHSQDSTSNCAMSAKIMTHPHFPRLLAAYVNCQKVGAPPEMVARLEEACASGELAMARSGTGCVGEDPALDQFMEAYCEMLTKYEQELTKPFKEAMRFLSRMECQFKALSVASSDSGRNGSSEEEIDANDNCVNPQAEDRELKGQLLRKYSGYLGNLKQEFQKKKKKGKLPKEARQQLLNWWSRHYKWPYPSEAQKLGLAESTGLDPKQINNWFINQRKRHWKPSEDMMDTAHPYYTHSIMGKPFPMDCTPTLL